MYTGIVHLCVVCVLKCLQKYISITYIYRKNKNIIDKINNTNVKMHKYVSK